MGIPCLGKAVLKHHPWARGSWGFGPSGGMFARRAPGALLLDYVPPEEPPSTPLGNTLRIR